jgi:phage-related protein
VIAAAESLRDAEQGLATARAQLKTAGTESYAAGGGAAALAAQQVADLSAAERAFLVQLQTTTEYLRGVFGPATDAVFASLTSALQALPSILNPLQGAFTTLGQAVGSAIGTLVSAFSTPAMIAGMKQLVLGAAQLAGPAAQGIAALAQILVNLANAAMPFLVVAFQAAADALAGWASSTSNVTAVRDVIGGLVSHLGSWLNLIFQISRIFLAFFQAAAPSGQSLVDSLAQGAAALANWLSSAEGIATIRTFFAAVIPLVQQIIPFIGQLAILFFQFVQAVAPFFTTMLSVANAIMGFLIPAFNAVMPFIQGFLEIFGSIFTQVLGGAVGIITTFIGIFQTAMQAMGISTETLRTGLTVIWNGIKSFFTTTWNAIKTLASTVWNGITSAISTASNAVRTAVTTVWNGIRTALTTVWNGLRTAATTAWNAIRTAITTVVTGIQTALSNAWSAIAGAAKTAWEGLRSFATSVWTGIKNAIVTPIDDALNFVRDMAEHFLNAGRAIVGGIVDGIRNGFGAVRDAMGDLGDIVRDMLPGSEPKDRRSPLRGLSDTGRAAVENIVSGFSGRIVRRRVRTALGAAFRDFEGQQAVARMLTNVARPHPVTPAGAGSVSRVMHQHNSFQVNTTGRGMPDPRAFWASLDTILANQGGLGAV